MKHCFRSNNFQASASTVSNNPASGVITLSLTAEQTAALDAERYVYDLEIVSATNVVTRALEGIITVRPEVTT